MFKKRINSIKYKDKKHTIWIPLALMFVMGLIVQLISGGIGELIPNYNGNEMITIKTLVIMTINLGLSLLIIYKLGKMSIQNVGFEFKNILSKILIGSLSGFLAITVVIGVINFLGGINIVYVFDSKNITTIFIALATFSIQGTYEEVVYRGYLFPHLAKSMNIFWAIIINSIFFTLLHALNPGMQIMPIINLMVASVVFSLVYYIWGNMWLSGFSHGIWNFSQGLIYGSLISGVEVEGSIFKSIPVLGKDLLSGASFGAEGSIITTTVGIIIIIVLIILIKKNKK